MAFIQSPGFVDGKPHQIHLIQRDPERSNGTLEDGGVGDVEPIVVGEHLLSRDASFLDSFWTEIDIGPAGEPVLLVPGAFAVSEQYKRLHDTREYRKRPDLAIRRNTNVSMESLRFVHAADLHLDSPFRGVGSASAALKERLQSATLKALRRVIDHTIHCKADFLIIAGDIYDSKDRNLRALVAFRNEMERLAERNVPVFIVHGNHDPLNGWGSGFKLPPNVVTFGSEADTEPFLRRGREAAQITGVSYMRERVTDNLASSLKPHDGAPYSIAVLHANVGHQRGHADYAPASVEELLAAGFHYWALGHVHTASVLAENPAMVVYPGNTQGRNPRETGPRGCYQVDVDAHGRAHLEFVDTSIARWKHIELSIANLNSMDQLVDSMLAQAREAAASFDGPMVTRCTIRGNGPLHRDLQRDDMNEELAEILGSTVIAESVRIATGPEIDFESLARTETMVSDFLRLTERALDDPEMRQRLADTLEPLYRRRDMPVIDDARLREWIERASSLGVDLLLGS
jgi:exonuclease SbcD